MVHKIPKTKTKWGPRFVFEVLKGRPYEVTFAKRK